MSIKKSEIVYGIMSFLNGLWPKDDRSVFIYDGPFMRQNCWALFRYLVDNGYNNDYRIYYFTNEHINSRYEGIKNVHMISSVGKGMTARFRSRFIFFEYDNFKFNCKRNKKQVSFNIWHGMPIKRIGYLTGAKKAHPYENDFSYVLVTAPYFKKIMQGAFNLTDDQIYYGGYPRNDDLFYGGKEGTSCELLRSDCKNVMWMPTFRKSASRNMCDLDSELPIINSGNIDEFNQDLAKAGIHLVIKSHPFQNKISWLEDKKFSNITVLSNKDIFDAGLELYQFIALFDGLVTDYSSIVFDYLLTGKPVLFAMDDLDEYKASRGFVDDNIYQEFEIPFANDYGEFMKWLSEGIGSADPEAAKRMQDKFTPLSRSGSFSGDICDFLGIKKQ